MTQTRAEPTSTLEVITPERAKHYLTFNTQNRPIRESHVRALMRQMRDGIFRVNGDAIRFATVYGEDGLPKGTILADGQHKLTACVRSGIPLRIFVVRGLEADAMSTIDNLIAPRSNHDQLALVGYVNTRNLSAAVNCIHMILRRSTSASKLGAQDVLAYVRRYPAIETGVRESMRCGLGSRSAVAAVYTLGCEVNQRLASELIDVMVNGTEDIGRPFNRFRERIIRSPNGRSYDSRASVQAALLIKAWNCEMTGTPMKVAVWRPANNEEFPTMFGLVYPTEEPW